jgi:hypothetical protein
VPVYSPTGRATCRWVSVAPTGTSIRPCTSHRADDLRPCDHGGTLRGL